ncbi:MAG: thioredoxin domain-containing protein [Psychrobium sp.]
MSSITLDCNFCKTPNKFPLVELDQSRQCNKCTKSITDGVVIEMLPHHFLPLSRSKRPLIIFMSGPNCSICKSFSETFAKSAQKFNKKVRFAHAYLPKHKALVSKYKIRGVPSIALFKQGKLQSIVNGGMRPKELTNFINNSLS